MVSYDTDLLAAAGRERGGLGVIIMWLCRT